MPFFKRFFGGQKDAKVKLDLTVPGDVGIDDVTRTQMKRLYEARKGEPPTKVERDLIVDDNDINRDILMRYLGRIGVHCDIARNGIDAIDLAMRYEYDIIWMDVKMPICNGFEATNFLRECGYKGNICGTTGFADEKSLNTAKECGMTWLITKPFTLDSIGKLHAGGLAAPTGDRKA